MSDRIADLYRQRIETFSRCEAEFGKRAVVFETVGRFCKWGLAGCLLLAWFSHYSVWSLMAPGLVLLVVSVGMDFAHRRAVLERDHYRGLRRINQLAVSRIDRKWDELPIVELELTNEQALLSEDLNLFGRASLFQLVCTASTPAGMRTLRDWLMNPAATDEIKRRQQAVAELAPQLEFRQDVGARCRMLAEAEFAEQDWLEWAEGGTWLTRTPWLKWLARGLTALTVAIPLLVLARVVPAPLGMPIFVAAIVANFVMMVLLVGKVHDIFAAASPRADGLSVKRSEKVFAVLSTVEGNAEEIADIRQHAQDACRSLQQLKRILQPASLSRNPWTAVLVYLPMQLLFLWDFHVLAILERWQRQHGSSVRRWFAALGHYEALESLASLAYDNPGWAFPSVESSNAPEFVAADCGHPLLPAASRVTNDVRIGPAGKLLLVTGSNMSGKSTLLRAVGTNVVLAQAGSAVCASRMVMPPLTVATSIRIVDSLKDGVSLFMAEVLRLKQIVDLARQFTHESKRTMLCLLDEILHGTNTSERRIAVRRVLGHLLGRNVIGAISTHDLELADDAALRDSFETVHFRESLAERSDVVHMTFDYKMRPGIAPTTNALKLLDMVGLEPA